MNRRLALAEAELLLQQMAHAKGLGGSLAVRLEQERLIADIEALCERLTPEQVAAAFERTLDEFPHLKRGG